MSTWPEASDMDPFGEHPVERVDFAALAVLGATSFYMYYFLFRRASSAP